MSKSQFRVIIYAKRKPIKLASARVSKFGDLFIAIRSGDKTRDRGKLRNDPGGPLHDQEIHEHRYTIHPTKGKELLNRINTHLVLKNGSEIQQSMMTCSLKKQNGFHCLYSRRGAPFSEDAPEIKGKVRTLSLGNHDEDNFVLQYTAFISKSNKRLDMLPPPGINQTDVILGAFRLTILWSFYTGLLMSTGLTIHPHFKNTSGRSDEIVQTDAIPESSIYDLHTQMCAASYEEMITTDMNIFHFFNDADEKYMREHLEYQFCLFSEGSLNSPDYIFHRESLPKADRLINLIVRELR